MQMRTTLAFLVGVLVGAYAAGQVWQEEMEGVQMNDITKQGEETHVEWRIKWRIMGNPVLSGESTPETILTIHPDGRVTISDKLKPTEIAALVLDQIKTQWMRDGQATKIMEMQ
jgi:hypothetical protein